MIHLEDVQPIHSHSQMRKRHEDDAGWAWVVCWWVVGSGCYIKGNVRMHHYVHSGRWVSSTLHSRRCTGVVGIVLIWLLYLSVDIAGSDDPLYVAELCNWHSYD